MKSTEHGEHLIQLTRLVAFNCYLVREADGATLVDAGLGDKSKAIMAAAAQHGMEIRRIALTHSHGDHVGALDSLAAQIPGVEVAIGEREAPIMAGDHGLRGGEAAGEIKGQFLDIRTAPTITLMPGDRVGSLEVVASPGHTPGHISFLDTRDGTLIAGDAITTQGGIAVAGVRRPLFPLPSFACWDLPTALESAVGLRALNPSRLATGHGKVLESPGAPMDDAIATAAKKVKAGDPPPPAPAGA